MFLIKAWLLDVLLWLIKLLNIFWCVPVTLIPMFSQPTEELPEEEEEEEVIEAPAPEEHKPILKVSHFWHYSIMSKFRGGVDVHLWFLAMSQKLNLCNIFFHANQYYLNDRILNQCQNSAETKKFAVLAAPNRKPIFCHDLCLKFYNYFLMRLALISN